MRWNKKKLLQSHRFLSCINQNHNLVLSDRTSLQMKPISGRDDHSSACVRQQKAEIWRKRNDGGIKRSWVTSAGRNKTILWVGDIWTFSVGGRGGRGGCINEAERSLSATHQHVCPHHQDHRPLCAHGPRRRGNHQSGTHLPGGDPLRTDPTTLEPDQNSQQQGAGETYNIIKIYVFKHRWSFKQFY